MKKLLFPLMAAFAIMANTVTYASEQVLTNSDAAALMAKAKEGGVSPSQISGVLSKMKDINLSYLFSVHYYGAARCRRVAFPAMMGG